MNASTILLYMPNYLCFSTPLIISVIKQKKKKVVINCLEYDIEEDVSGSWNDRSAHEMVT